MTTPHAQYLIRSINRDTLTLNGKGDHPLWNDAEILTDFSYPWEDESPPATTFRALHNHQAVFLLYACHDERVLIQNKTHDKSAVIASDRVEIFFRRDAEMTPYYAFEIDPQGRLADYRANFHRQFDLGWSWPADQIKIKSIISEAGYSVEVELSKASLEEFGLIKDSKIEAGIFRANCAALTEDNSAMRWISWLRPDSETPDFHIPSAFGHLRLE